MHRIAFFHFSLSTTMDGSKELSMDVREKTVDVHRLDWAARPSVRRLVRRWQLLVLFIQKWKNNKMPIDHSHSGAMCKILSHAVRMIVRKVVAQPKTTESYRWSLLMIWRPVGTTVSKNTINNNTLQCNGLKSCSARKVPLLKEAHVQAHLKFVSEHLNNSEKNYLWRELKL